MSRVQSSALFTSRVIARIFAFSLAGVSLFAQTWTQVNPAGTPPAPRGLASIILDVPSNRVVVFGGTDNPTNYNDALSLDLSVPRWSSLVYPISRPQARADNSTIYDPTSARMIIFGGTLGNASPCANDLWALGGVTSSFQLWNQLSPSGTPPSVRHGHTAVYDSNSNRMIVFGGNNCFSTNYNDVWILSNANGVSGTPTWAQLTTTNAPPARYSHTAVYDPSTNRMTVFGGGSSSGVLGDVWVLSNANGLGGASVWTQINPTGTSIGLRGGHTAVYSPASNRMIVFSGGNDTTPTFNDVWILTNANGVGGASAWFQLNPSGTLPPPRSIARAVYDPVHDLMTIFGGYSNGASQNDVWTLSGAASINLQPMITTSCPLPSGSYGSQYGPLQLTSTLLPPVNWSISSRALPTGINLSTQGIVLGVPTTTGTFTFDLTAMSSSSFFASATQSCSVTINPQTITLNPSMTPVGSSTFTLTVNGAGFNATSVVQWNGSPLTTIFVTSSQIIATVPATLVSRQGTATVTVVSGSNTSTPATFTIGPGITTQCPLPGGTYGISYGPVQLTSTISPPVTYAIASGQLPTGINLSSQGLIVGVPTTTGTFFFNLGASNPLNSPPVNVTQSCSVTITPQTLTITNSCPLPAAIVGTAYSTTLTASGGVGPYVWTVSSGSLPGGLTLNGSIISGVPTGANGPFILTVTDSTGATVSSSCSLIVSTPPPPPSPPQYVITASCPLPTGYVGSNYQAGLSGTANGLPVSFTIAGSLPPGLGLDNNTVRGTPTRAGDYSFSLRLGDQTKACGMSVVANPLVLTGCPLPDGRVNTSYSASFDATGGTAPYYYFASGLPTNVSQSGPSISGQPSTAGSYNVLLRVTDTAGISSSQTCPVVIAAAPPQPPLSISGVSLPNGTVGVPYGQQVTASGGLPPYRWSASGLPAGLGINDSGLISGTPQTAGTATVTVTVTDSQTPSSSASATLALKIVSAPPTITTACPIPDGRVGSAYSLAFTASAGNPPYTWDVSAGAPPGGLMLGSSGVLSGSPTAAGLFNFTVRVTDQSPSTATKACSVNIVPTLTISGITPSSLVAGSRATDVTVTGTGFSASSIVQWNGSSLPTDFISSTQLVAHVSADLLAKPGTATLTVVGSDGAISARFSISIALPTFPQLQLTSLGSTLAPATQPALLLSLSAPYAYDIQVTLKLDVVANTGSSDPNINHVDTTVQFPSGASTTVTIPAGSTQATIPMFSTGTVASTITLSISSVIAAGQNIPNLPPTQTATIAAAVPVITSSCYTPGTGVWQVAINGYTTTRSLTQVAFTFTAASGANLTTTTVSTDLSSASSYFQTPASWNTGGSFGLTVPLNIQGDSGAIGSISAVVSNRIGSSPSQAVPVCGR